MKPRKTAWPHPGDTALDRARRIAREYRAALAKADPDRCAAIDSAATALGETWVTPTLVTSTSTRLTARELAATVGVKPGTVYMWVSRGVIAEPDVDGKHDLDDVRARLRDRRKGKAA